MKSLTDKELTKTPVNSEELEDGLLDDLHADSAIDVTDADVTEAGDSASLIKALVAKAEFLRENLPMLQNQVSPTDNGEWDEGVVELAGALEESGTAINTFLTFMDN